MNAKLMVRISNIIGVVSIVLLMYWVFSFIMANVFDLRVFRQTITETFTTSILGILVLMLGSLMMNIMFNLTRIAEKDEVKNKSASGFVKLFLYMVCAGFPIIAGFIFWGNYRTKEIRKEVLRSRIESLTINKKTMDSVAQYSFSVDWCKHVHRTLTSHHFIVAGNNQVEIIVPEILYDSKVFLSFDKHSMNDWDSTIHDKEYYLYKPDAEDREYLFEVFSGKTNDIHFRSDGNNDILFVPYIVNNKRVIISISNYQRYGKY